MFFEAIVNGHHVGRFICRSPKDAPGVALARAMTMGIGCCQILADGTVSANIWQLTVRRSR